MQKQVLPIRVYYEDTDAGGIVYHANYLKFFERGRVESLRAFNIELTDLLESHDAQFVLRTANVEFLQSARLDQLLYVVSEIVEVRHASILYNQAIHLQAVEGPILCQASIRLACLNRALRPRGLPNFLSMEIKQWLQISH